MKTALQTSLLCWVSTAFLACGGGGASGPDSAVDAGGGVCGTHAAPGILKITGLTPAIGAWVLDQSIVHSFVVENAPAIFTSFTLRGAGDAHTAGNSTPFEPTFQVTVAGSNLIYQTTINTWSRAPGHVELVASGGYDTSKGCSWVFPSPLFSYDVSPLLDAGVVDAGVVDAGVADAGVVDAGVVDAGVVDVPGEADGGGSVAVDVAAIDADIGTSSVDASIDN